MAWPVTINGHTYNENHFSPYAYTVNFPLIIADVATTAGQVAADRATVAADKGVVAADRATVAADKAIVAADKLTVYNDRLLADAGALTASQALGLLADATDSVAISTGDKTFTVPAGKSFVAGMPLRVSSKANPDTQFMTGVVKSYSGTALVFAAQAVTGSATRADWTIAVTGGALAPFGATQDAQAIARYAEKMDGLRAAAVPDRPNILLDFLDSTFFVRGAYAGASMLALVAALSGSTYARASTATYFGSDGLLKTAAINEPRFEYAPVTRQALGLLIEPARTNLFTYSEQIDNAVWTKSFTTVVANAAVAPDGATTADKLVENTGNGGHLLIRSVTSANGAAHTVSHYVQAGERSRLRIQLDNGFIAFANCTFDLIAGTMSSLSGTGVTAGITPAGGGRWRIWLTGTSTSTTVREVVYIVDNAGASSYTGDGTSGLFIWGSQLEVGTAPTSYIPTVASTVTRAADGAPTFITAIPAAFSALIEHQPLSIRSDGNTAFPLYLTGATNDLFSLREGTVITGADLFVKANNVTTIDTPSYSAAVGSVSRFAFGISPTSWTFVKDGGAPTAGMSGGATVPTTDFNRVIVGESDYHGYIRRVFIAPGQLSNAKLQALSTAATWS